MVYLARWIPSHLAKQGGVKKSNLNIFYQVKPRSDIEWLFVFFIDFCSSCQTSWRRVCVSDNLSLGRSTEPCATINARYDSINALLSSF